MSIFGKDFNVEVFRYDVGHIENTARNELIKSRAIRQRPELAATMAQQNGGNIITTVLKGLIGGKPKNYDGSSNSDPSTTGTYRHTRVVVGRWEQWEEKDFARDMTGSEDFMGNIEQQVADYWWEVQQGILISILKGVFGMTSDAGKAFATKHTHDITNRTNSEGTLGMMDMTSINTCMQRACGDNKGKFSLMFCHSAVATNLENMKLLAYLKYTDKDGTQRDLTIGQVNGRIVLVDDTMPSKDVYEYAKTSDAAVQADKTYYTKTGESYVEVAEPSTEQISTYYEATYSYTEYTSYVLGDGAIEFTDVGAEVPYETKRDPELNGGTDLLFSRQRWCYAPYGISFTQEVMESESPTDEELENGDNWEIVSSTKNGETTYLNDKVIHIARILSRG